MTKESLFARWALVVCAAIAMGAAGAGAGEMEGVGAGAGQTGEGGDAAPVRDVDLATAEPMGFDRPDQAMDPVEFVSPKGKRGWVVRLPGNGEIPTPAFANETVFCSGGFSSRQFFALRSSNGRQAWGWELPKEGAGKFPVEIPEEVSANLLFPNPDPTPAAVRGKLVVFNCGMDTVEAVDARTGRTQWRQRLGFPLVTQPALDAHNVYVAHPVISPLSTWGRERNEYREKLIAVRDQMQGRPLAAVYQRLLADELIRSEHRLACLKATDGTQQWSIKLDGDVITAPVPAGRFVYFTSTDGSAWCVRSSDGQVAWKHEGGATSAPLILGGYVLFTEQRETATGVAEGIRRLSATTGEPMDDRLIAEATLDHPRDRMGINPDSQAQTGQRDVTVLRDRLGKWAYQGPRLASANGRLFLARGSELLAVDPAAGKVAWRVRFATPSPTQEDLLLPPALGKQNVYLNTTQGHVLSLRQEDGRLNFAFATEEPMLFQPALAGGRIIVGTANGLVIAFYAGDLDAFDWHGWGGDSTHNRRPDVRE